MDILGQGTTTMGNLDKVLMEKNPVILKDSKAGFSQDHQDIDIRTSAMRFYSVGERLSSTPNTAWASGKLQSRMRIRAGGWKITNRNHQG